MIARKFDSGLCLALIFAKPINLHQLKSVTRLVLQFHFGRLALTWGFERSVTKNGVVAVLKDTVLHLAPTLFRCVRG